MPRIGRGNPASSPSHEQTGDATPPRSPDLAGGSAAGRRERPGLLGFLRRPFRGSGSSTHASGSPSASPQHEHAQASTSRAAPRTAAALLQRSPVLSRGHGEEVMARLEQSHAETPGRSADGPPFTSRARGALAPQPAHQSPYEAHAATITQQLRDAGVDLSHVRRNVRASMRGAPMNFDGQALPILLHHFPHIFEVGLLDNPLAAALYANLRRETSQSRAGSSSRTAQGAPSRSPAGRALTPQPASQSPHEAHAARIVDELRNEGHDLRTVHQSLSALMHRGQMNMRRSVGIILARHFPLLAMAGIQANDPLAVALLHALKLQTSAGQILAAYGSLRAISHATAQRLGFKDAAIHGEDDATHCTFGEALSTLDPAQRVIGLANEPSNPPHAFDAGVNKEVVFMDLAKLAEYLDTNPRHPSTRTPLDASNILNYAFRIE